MKLWSLKFVVYLVCLVFLLAATSSAYPAGDPEAVSIVSEEFFLMTC